MTLRRAIPHIFGLLLSLLVVLVAFRGEVEQAVFPVLTNIRLEPVQRTSDRLFFRTLFHKNRDVAGVYSAWAMYGPGDPTVTNRFLFTPEKCDTTEPIQGGVTPNGVDADYTVCATIPAQLSQMPIKISGVVFYRAWHGGLVPVPMPVLSVEPAN